jgi:transcriptional regulator with XRE-family HTH domain
MIEEQDSQSGHTGEPQTIQELMAEMNITQAQLAHKLGISTNSVNAWFRGKAIPKADNFLAMCRELNMSPKQMAKWLKLDTSGIPDD